MLAGVLVDATGRFYLLLSFNQLFICENNEEIGPLNVNKLAPVLN